MDQRVWDLYFGWCNEEMKDLDLTRDLEQMQGNEEAVNDAFYRDLEFGTAGLRGVLGAGTNRMNVYTVGRATAGYAEYLKSVSDSPSMAIAYDSRHKSDVFARETAAIMAARGVHVYLWPELMPTPMLSFAVRYYHCNGGVVITASHNPSPYNGYKAYDETGCQISEETAARVLEKINAEPMFPEEEASFDKGLADGNIEYIPQSVFDAFIEAAGMWADLGAGVDKSVRIAYTPLYGAGFKPVMAILKKHGFTDIVVVEEQMHPNGDFPTCPYPNPEIREAMQVGLETAKKAGADLLIATDPDSDRIGIAVRDGDDFRLISGNQTGMLIFDWLCKMRTAKGKMPENPVAVKSIVSTDMIYKIAGDYGVSVVDVLTGFKNIAPIVTGLAEKNQEERYVFGYEESYGYMLGTHVRDKDAVSAALIIAEMFAYYKGEGRSLLEVLDSIYDRHGFYLNNTRSFQFPGESGFAKMQEIMNHFRAEPLSSFAGIPVEELQDYKDGYQGIPASNVIKYVLQNHGMLVLRPSGTEPKLKLYTGVSAATEAEAAKLDEEIVKEVIEKYGLEK